MEFGFMLADTAATQRLMYNVETLNIPQREAWTKEYVLQAQVELAEVLGCINWKHHVIDRKAIDYSDLLYELVDVQKFLCNLFHVWRFTAQEVDDAWAIKTNKVLKKLASQGISGQHTGTELLASRPDEQALAQLRFELQETKAELAEANRNLQVLHHEMEALR